MFLNLAPPKVHHFIKVIMFESLPSIWWFSFKITIRLALDMEKMSHKKE